MSEERLKENKRKVERMVKRMDCQMDVLAEADIFKKGGKGAAERKRRARTARAEQNRVDEIITHGYKIQNIKIKIENGLNEAIKS